MMVKRIQADVVEDAVIESFPRFEGRQMVMMIAPGRKKPVVKQQVATAAPAKVDAAV